MDDQLGQTLRRERQRAGMSVASFALSASISQSYVRHIENGTRPVTAEIADIYDGVLKAGGLIADLYLAHQNGDDMRRRTLLALLGTVAGTTSVSAPKLATELLRTELLSVLGTDDWTDIAADYGRRFMVDPPDQLRVRLVRDLLMLRNALHDGESVAARMGAPRLMLIQGMMLANAGDTEDGHRWYRAARIAADEAADADLQQWTRGREAFRLGYEGAAPELVLRLATGVRDVEAHLAVAQAYARLDVESSARRALDEAWRLYDVADQDEQTIYTMPPWRMALSSAYVHALLGDVAGSDQLLDQVSPPPSVARWQAQREVQRAVALARSRDTRSALELTRTVTAGAAPDERSVVLSEMCRLVESSAMR